MRTDIEEILLAADRRPPPAVTAATAEDFDRRVSAVFQDVKDVFGPPVQRHYIQDSQGVVHLEKVVERQPGQFESLLSLVFSCEADLVCVRPGRQLQPAGDMDRDYLDLILGSLGRHRFVAVLFDEVNRPYTGERFAEYCSGPRWASECTWYWRFFSYL